MIDVGGKRISLQKIFEHGETIELSGKCVVHLAAGRVYILWTLS